MASRAFLDVLKKTQQTKDLSEVMVGSGSKWLSEGRHDVVIQGVDCSDLDQDRIKVTYGDDEGNSFTDMVFLLSRNKEEMSFPLRMLLSALIPDTDALSAFLEAMDEDQEAFNMFTGMKLRVILKQGPGFIIKSLGTGNFAAFDHESGNQLTEEFPSAQEARDEALAKGLKKSYLRVNRTEPTHAEANTASLYTAIEGKRRAKKASGGIGGSNLGSGSAGTTIA